MFVADQVILMLFALTGCGLLICFSPSLTGQQSISLGPFWLISVGPFSISFCLFASISVVDPIIQTLANFFNLASFAFCALLFRSWRVRIARHLTTSAWTGLVICALLYEQLRLQGSFYDRVIFVSPWWTAAMMDQAVARAVRMGQTKTVQVYYLMLHTEKSSSVDIDSLVSTKADQKRDMLQRLFQLCSS